MLDLRCQISEAVERFWGGVLDFLLGAVWPRLVTFKPKYFDCPACLAFYFYYHSKSSSA